MGLTIPKERVIIDAISLDEEIQLERDEQEEEFAPINRLWDAFRPGQTWPAALPMRTWHPRPGLKLNHLQVAFIKHIIYQGEVWADHNLRFRTALDIHHEHQVKAARHRGEATDILSRMSGARPCTCTAWCAVPIKRMMTIYK